MEQELPPLDLEALPPDPGSLEPRASAAPPSGIDADLLERTAAELQPRAASARDEDLVSEAEVLAKYGLEDKALERLREALRLRPQNVGAYATMVQIHLDKGRHERVVELANAMSRVAAEVRDAQHWPKTRRHLIEAGYRLDGDRVVADPYALREAEPAPAPAPPAPVAAAPPVLEAVEVPAVPEVPVVPEVREARTPEPEPPPAATPPAPAAPLAPRKRSSGEIDQMLRGLLDPKPRRPAAPAMKPPVFAAPDAAPDAAPEPPPAASAVPPPAPAAAAPGPTMFNPLEIGEMIESEDFDWEPPIAAAAAAAAAAASAPPSPPKPPAGQSLPQSLDDTGGLSWLDEADRDRPAKQARTESLFDDEDDFFDLAAELEQELSQEDLFKAGETMLAPQAEQSLEEIVEGFKKGVAEHLSPTDYDTHFNLGIAYREMGLLDEAIGEFQIAAKDAGHLVLCCSMLGLCFLDKGLPELAVKWYRRGLEAPGLTEEDHLGLLYDLGCSYLVLDDKASAYKAFVDLYGINNAYRDVVARIEELGR
jgi:tetratricopeptide (TPR) repeat protein